MRCGSQVDQDVAAQVLKLLEGILSKEVVQRQISQHSNLAVRGVLELSGKYARDQRTFRESIERFSEATKALAVQLGRGDPESHGLFACVGGSTTEYMISGKLWLEKGLLESQLSQRWFPIQIVCRMVASELRQDPTTDLQVAFCVNTLCGILLNPALQIVHVQCLEALTELLEAIVSKCPSSNTVRKDVASFASELLATCMHVHERGQQLLVKNCTDARWYRDRALKRSLGILGMRKSDLSTTDAWGWDRNTSDVTFRDDRASLESALAEFHSLADKHTLDAITGSFKVLNFLLQNATSIGLHPDDCVGASPPYEVDSFHYDVLFQLNPELSAQKLVLEWLEGSQSSSNLVTSVPAIVRRLRLKDDAENTMNGAASALEPRGPMCKPDEGDSGIFSIDQRLLRAELVQLQCFLKQLRSEPEQDTGSRLQVNESGKLVRVILGYCGMEYSEQVRLAASTCLGEIDLAAIHSLPTSEYIEEPPKDWIDTAIASKHLLRSLQAQSIERLVSCLKSPQVNVAMVALETLKSLLVTHEGAQCLDILKHRSTTSTLGHFISEGRPKKANSQLCLSEKEIHELKIDAHVSSTSEDWCWNKQLWCRIHDEGTSFDNWICVLVPALLVCCYGDVESSAPGQNSSSEFFSTCQRMSNLEPSFAVAVFPAIILELLATRSDEDRVPGAQGVLSDTWVGSGKTPFNINLSKCFTSLLEGYTTDTREGGRKHSRDTRPIDLIVDTLDTLRRFTQHRFLQSSDHKKNPSSLDEAMSDEAQKTGTGSVSQGRSSKPQRSHSSFDDLGDAPPWRGLTFGVVLHLDGLLVTQACIKARRFAAALFYAELYADARFGRSTGLVSSLSDVEKRGVAASCSPLTSDVSGFDIALSSIAGLVGRKVAVETLHHDALNFMNLLRNCFVDLGEEEARRAVDEQASDLRFACNTVSTGSGSLAGELSPSLYDLQLIDNIAGLERRSASSRLATVECLERLGLRNTLQTYIGGLNMESGSVFRDDDTASLREKWFECRLYDMQWDDSLLHEQASDESDASNRLLKRSMIGLGSPLEGVWNDTNATEGFHEWTVKAMLSLTRDDTALCSIHLTAARGQLLNRMSTLATGEMSRAGTLDVIDRLQVLNDLDGLFSKSESLQGVLARWTQRDTTLNESQQGTIALFENTDKAPSSSHDFSQWVREITLRCLCLTHSKRDNQDDPRVFEHLATHIWRICSANYDSGRYNVAEAALQRLYRLLRFSGGIQGERPDSLTLFRLRLQEAILLESKGNFTGAIRLLKQTLKRIPDEKASAERESLMADALVTCGRLMTKHKVEPANTILDNYLKKGSNVALAAYMKNMTTTTARSATNAFLAMGQVASNIFETVAARVKSLEWQQAGKGILDRKKELGECHKLIKELEDRLQSSRKRKKQSKETYELERELLEAKIYQTQLAREITNASTERKQIQSSVVTYRSLALQAFVSALSIADSRGPADMSRHVYRMVSLWLSGEIVQSEGGKVATTTIEAVDTTMTKAMETIPSFRFVPLSSQLFSRLGFDDANHSNRVSQELLQRLVFKMCLDHPYHCLVHLITLSNGQKVGTGVGGRQANVFLENTGGTKVEKAKEILEALKNKDLLFICRLIESMESLADAYIHLAMVDTKSFPRAKKTILFSQVCVSKKQPRLDQCLGSGARKPPCAPCILTSPPPLRPGCDYGGGREDPPGAERIVGFESCFSITDGGLHRPKIVVCLGSKGGRFKQLVKGEDEIRQDAVMEQVFGYVNELMTRHTFGQRDSPKSEGSSGQILASTKSTLKLVTYNIIPLSPASGVSICQISIRWQCFLYLTNYWFSFTGSGMGREYDPIRRIHD
jgi:tetratricopeptide (TPR) repeat protein